MRKNTSIENSLNRASNNPPSSQRTRGSIAKHVLVGAYAPPRCEKFTAVLLLFLLYTTTCVIYNMYLALGLQTDSVTKKVFTLQSFSFSFRTTTNANRMAT